MTSHHGVLYSALKYFIYVLDDGKQTNSSNIFNRTAQQRNKYPFKKFICKWCTWFKSAVYVFYVVKQFSCILCQYSYLTFESTLLSESSVVQLPTAFVPWSINGKLVQVSLIILWMKLYYSSIPLNELILRYFLFYSIETMLSCTLDDCRHFRSCSY